MPDIGQPSASDKNSDAEIRDAVVSDATRFPGGNIDQQVSQAGAPLRSFGQFRLTDVTFIQGFDVSNQDTQPEGMAIKPDGTKLYVLGESATSVHQYSLPTAFDLRRPSFDQSFDFSTQDTFPEGMSFTDNGTRLYINGRGNGEIYQYSLSTAFDVSTASFVQNTDGSFSASQGSGLVVSSDGTQVFFTDSQAEEVVQSSLSPAFDISTISRNKSFSVRSQDTRPKGVVFTPDGGRMYVAGRGNSSVFQYRLSTGFDISTASFHRAFSVDTETGQFTGLRFSPDGSQLYAVSRSSSEINQYAVGTVGADES